MRLPELFGSLSLDSVKSQCSFACLPDLFGGKTWLSDRYASPICVPINVVVPRVVYRGDVEVGNCDGKMGNQGHNDEVEPSKLNLLQTLLCTLRVAQFVKMAKQRGLA